jgi:hypothetical protein
MPHMNDTIVFLTFLVLKKTEYNVSEKKLGSKNGEAFDTAHLVTVSKVSSLKDFVTNSAMVRRLS